MRGGIKFAILLILVGTLFLLVNSGVLPTIYQPLFTSWPIWVVFAGIYSLLGCAPFFGITLLAVGGFFMVPQMGAVNPLLHIPANFVHLYWPSLLVLAGVLFLIHRLFFHNHWCHPHCFKGKAQVTNSFGSEDGFLRVNTRFDSRKNIVIDPIFRGGELNCSFGEITMDLRKTTLQEGESVLKVNVSFGEVNVVVPSDWNVLVRGESAFGSFSDGRWSPSYDPNASQRLIVEGSCSFGECKVKD
jgi:predicted membrane protein